MNDPIMKAFARDINDLRERLDKLEGKRTQSPSYEDLLDRSVRDYTHLRELYRHICDCNDAVETERMCRNMMASFNELRAERDRYRDKCKSEREQSSWGNSNY